MKIVADRTGERFLTGIAWVHDVCLFLLCYLIASGIMAESGRTFEAYWLYGCFLFLPLLISYLGVRKLKHFLLFVPLGLVFTAVTWLILEDALTTALTFLIFLFRVAAQIRKGQAKRELEDMQGATKEGVAAAVEGMTSALETPRAAHLIFYAAAYFILYFLDRRALLPWVSLLLLADVICFFLYKYVEGRTVFLAAKFRQANVPVQALKRICRMMLLPLLGALVIGLLPVFFWEYDPLEHLEFQERRAQQEETEPPAEQQETGQESPGEDTGASLEDLAEPPKWLSRLAYITQFVLAAGVVALIFFGVFLGLKRLMRVYAAGEEDQVIFLEGDGPTDEIFRQKSGRTPGWFSHEAGVRRKYKRLIRRNLKTRPSGTETPEELEQLAGLKIDELHREYEQARYGE